MPRRRTVSVLAYDGMSAFETGIATEVFGLAWPDIGVEWYDLVICAEHRGPVPMLGGATLRTPHGLDEFAAADTVLVPSVADVAADPSPGVVAALRRAHRRGARIVSICTGAFALAAAGLLDGRRATTHWRYADGLRRRYPRVEVDPNPLYVEDGGVFTSAGCAAGLDLCLHLVREDLGATVANSVARRMVVPPHRDGGQAQYIETPVARDPEDDRVADSMRWAAGHLTERITVAKLAARARMSPRSYLRHFTRATGTSPIRWLVMQRVQASLPLLETTDSSIEQVAHAVGFDTAVNFRHHFTRAMRTSPSAYRRTFEHRRT
ncbi:helix-turn-helix domain-containing protein [Qaidamihabitans albus]|uniref:helix-turn-helix domain-containing protein n=1 Tax=Qaidamihabitans albus TaxID=2795733 RepID=UPI0018F262F3|nr:helix-turn-helix domain-containing protein [Qaidamihabitans albus]